MHPLRDRKAVVRSRSRSTLLLTIYFLVALIIPNCVLANTEHYPCGRSRRSSSCRWVST